jgi:hypothetical protein
LESAPVDHVPFVPTSPFQPPEAVQVVASCELQLKVDVPPLCTVVGDADSVTVGAGGVSSTCTD